MVIGEIAVEFEFLLAPAPIPYLKPNFFHLVHPNSSPGCFQAGRED